VPVEGGVSSVQPEAPVTSAPAQPPSAGNVDINGERYDATRELPGWSRPGFDDTGWGQCRRGELDVATLVAPDGPPARATGGLSVRETITTPSGKTVLDFGQNLVGRLRIRVSGRRGATVTIRHAEVLEDGELPLRPLRTARATDSYTLRGDSAETICLVVAEHFLNNDSGDRSITMGGIYTIGSIRSNLQWKIKTWTLKILWYRGNPGLYRLAGERFAQERH